MQYDENLREIDRKLIRACRQLNGQAVRQFIRDGADVNAAHGAPIFAVTDWCMVERGDGDEVDPRTYGILELLLDSGARPDGDDPEDSPLCHFVYRSFEICELLISRGANVNFCVEEEERTVLDMVLEEIMARGDDTPEGVRLGYAKTLRLLEKHRAVTYEELVERRKKAAWTAERWRAEKRRRSRR